jgi:hypothetical protein
MTRANLIACPACARHVRISEPTCPFCKGSLAEAALAFTARQAPTQRLSRAALYAFGMGSITVVAACGGAVAGGSGGPGGKDSGADDANVLSDSGQGNPFPDVIETIYGAPFDASFEQDTGEPDDAGFAQDVSSLPPYGISPPFDAAQEPDADTDDGSTDAGNPADVGVAVPYGVPGVIFHDK